MDSVTIPGIYQHKDDITKRIEVIGAEQGQKVKFFPAGGVFQHVMSWACFVDNYEPASTEVVWIKAFVEIDDSMGPYPCFLMKHEPRWNGWQRPVFERHILEGMFTGTDPAVDFVLSWNGNTATLEHDSCFYEPMVLDPVEIECEGFKYTVWEPYGWCWDRCDPAHGEVCK